jgi:hypothetical protein
MADHQLSNGEGSSTGSASATGSSSLRAGLDATSRYISRDDGCETLLTDLVIGLTVLRLHGLSTAHHERQRPWEIPLAEDTVDRFHILDGGICEAGRAFSERMVTSTTSLSSILLWAELAT